MFATGGNNGPIDLTFGPDGNLYVLNSFSSTLEVLRFNGVTGAFIDVFVSSFSGGTDRSSLTFGPDGNLYVTTGFIGNSVLRFNSSSGQFIDEFVSSGSGGLNYATGLLFLPSTSVPEPSLVIGFLALGTVGAGSTLKRKLKTSKSTEKETTKVG